MYVCMYVCTMYIVCLYIHSQGVGVILFSGMPVRCRARATSPIPTIFCEAQAQGLMRGASGERGMGYVMLTPYTYIGSIDTW